MTLLERMRERMSGSLSRVIPALKRSRSVLQTNRWDEATWKEVRATPKVDRLVFDVIQGDLDVGGTKRPYELGAELLHDLFMTFYKANPTLLGKSQVVPEVYPLRRVLEELMDNPRLKELQDLTAGDPVMSTLAVQSVQDIVRGILDRVDPPPRPEDDKGDKGDQGGDGGEDDTGDGTPGDQSPGEGQPGDQPGDQPDGDGEGGDGGEGESQAELDWQAAFDDILDDVDFERLLRGALDEAADTTENLDSLLRNIGLEKGEWQSMSPAARFAMAERLSTPEMRQLADWVGRVARFSLGVRATRIIDAPHEVCDVETGNDLTLILRSEFALLGHPQLRWEFYRKYLDQELLQYRLRGEENVGKGPVVVAIDKSSSMKGHPFDWAMGVAEALRRFASLEGRDYFAMFFGNNEDRHRFDFPGGVGPFEKVMAFLSCVANGGTQFDGVLDEALSRATTHFDATGEGKADIVFITDGAAQLSEEWIAAFNQERERVGVRVFSVYIGGAADNPRSPVPLLERISDVVIPVTDLRPEAVSTIFERV